MANLPSTRPESTLSAADERFYEAIADHIAAGRRPAEIARRVYPTDAHKRGSLRRRIWRMVRQDTELHRRLALRARGEMALGLGPSASALAGRAGRGRVDAIKLLFESTGFHNPKINHEHSGEIKVSLSIPRPAFDEITDAQVVED